MSDTNLTLAGALLAASLLWPAQGHAYCSLLASKMEQAVCDMDDRARWQQLELERLNNRVKEMEAAETQRWLADDQRRRDDSARELKAWMDDFPSRLPRYGQP